MAHETKSNPPGTQVGFGPGNPTQARGGEKTYFAEGPHIDDAEATYTANTRASINAVIAELRRRGFIHDES